MVFGQGRGLRGRMDGRADGWTGERVTWRSKVRVQLVYV